MQVSRRGASDFQMASPEPKAMCLCYILCTEILKKKVSNEEKQPTTKGTKSPKHGKVNMKSTVWENHKQLREMLGFQVKCKMNGK